MQHKQLFKYSAAYLASSAVVSEHGGPCKLKQMLLQAVSVAMQQPQEAQILTSTATQPAGTQPTVSVFA